MITLKDKEITIAAVVAMANNRVIGRNNQLPWHYPNDLKHFKAVTMGKPILMGRNTFESIGRPLPGRQNIVLTTNEQYNCEGCTVVTSLESIADAIEGNEVFLIGGGKLYETLLPQTDTLYLTKIEHDFEGDTYFPALNDSDWQETENVLNREDEKHPYPYRFITLRRVG